SYLLVQPTTNFPVSFSLSLSLSLSCRHFFFSLLFLCLP
ncbi:unnamed protein product, partial [Musa acuminata subsp. malaccensis]